MVGMDSLFCSREVLRTMRRPVFVVDSAVTIAFCIACLFVLDASAIGVNLGQVADNLLPADQILLLVQSTTINKVKLFGADPVILNAFAGSGIEIVVGTGNDQIVPFANTPGFALQWVQANVAAYPNTKITAIAVGNEVLAYAPTVAYQLLPAMQNLQAALVTLGLDAQVKVGTPSDMSVLAYSEPPSNASFHEWEGSILGPIFPFLASTGAPFMVNAYPYFAYTSDPQNTSLNFVLFRPNATETRHDNVTGITYTSMWDAQMDALYTAIAKMGFNNISLSITETGWPHAGGTYEIGPCFACAQIFNSELIKRINANVGSPLKPGVPIDAYIFELFDEDQKPGAPSEHYFGMFYANGTPVYNAGIIPAWTPAAPVPTSPPSPFATPPPPVSPSPLSPPEIFSPPPPSIFWSPPPPSIYWSPPPPPGSPLPTPVVGYPPPVIGYPPPPFISPRYNPYVPPPPNPSASSRLAIEIVGAFSVLLIQAVLQYLLV